MLFTGLRISFKLEHIVGRSIFGWGTGYWSEVATYYTKAL